jgi:hypothetical protein
MVAGQVSCLVKSYLPFMQPLHVIIILFFVILKPLHMDRYCFTITPGLMSHMSRFHVIENRQNQATLCFVAFHDVDKFFQTERRRSIIDREDRNENSGLFDGCDK